MTFVKGHKINQGRKLTDEIKKKKSVAIKKAYKEGRMDYMKEVWDKNKEEWQGDKNPRWKPIGSKRYEHGYVLIKVDNNIWIKEDRFIAEKIIGRKIKSNETVHHINGKRDDNREENLYLMTRTEHKAWHTLDNLNKDLKDNRPNLKSNLHNVNY